MSSSPQIDEYPAITINLLQSPVLQLAAARLRAKEAGTPPPRVRRGWGGLHEPAHLTLQLGPPEAPLKPLTDIADELPWPQAPQDQKDFKLTPPVLAGSEAVTAPTDLMKTIEEVKRLYRHPHHLARLIAAEMQSACNPKESELPPELRNSTWKTVKTITSAYFGPQSREEMEKTRPYLISANEELRRELRGESLRQLLEGPIKALLDEGVEIEDRPRKALLALYSSTKEVWMQVDQKDYEEAEKLEEKGQAEGRNRRDELDEAQALVKEVRYRALAAGKEAQQGVLFAGEESHIGQEWAPFIGLLDDRGRWLWGTISRFVWLLYVGPMWRRQMEKLAVFAIPQPTLGLLFAEPQRHTAKTDAQVYQENEFGAQLLQVDGQKILTLADIAGSYPMQLVLFHLLNLGDKQRLQGNPQPNRLLFPRGWGQLAEEAYRPYRVQRQDGTDYRPNERRVRSNERALIRKGIRQLSRTTIQGSGSTYQVLMLTDPREEGGNPSEALEIVLHPSLLAPARKRLVVMPRRLPPVKGKKSKADKIRLWFALTREIMLLAKQGKKPTEETVLELATKVGCSQRSAKTLLKTVLEEGFLMQTASGLALGSEPSRKALAEGTKRSKSQSMRARRKSGGKG